ncbi:uncharacterized protein I303_104217 [Kwoniella dejecticola CBS 10117]|uniref:Uncharacterized protein n=1 Tax=Kwoniella dejecticola CBS 10117 TaxID=1296121 RepID=A0A1A6A5Z2_9TREE|nr:uncharacterized protein I303_04807 [Kwoniella dejecticola CBS 10117]OBR85471.1 hypothetical protein I303_04807 [Kwoniella dejecticola CBS 10117]
MSHLQNVEDKIKHTFTSGQPGTTGREPFEEDRGEGNPFHRQHQHDQHGGHGLTGASETGHHSIGTGSDLIGKSSTGTGNERDINSGEGLRSHEQNPSRVGGTGTGAGIGSGTGSGLTGSTGTHTGAGTGHHARTGQDAGAIGAGAGIATAEYEANKHSGHHHSGTGSGLTGNNTSGNTGSSLTGQGHDSTHTGLAGTGGVGNRGDNVNYPSAGSGLGSGGTAGGAGITAGTHAGHHHGTGSDLTTHQHEHGTGSGLAGSHAGTTGAAGGLENAARRETGTGDRTGNLGQDSALYERTGPGGPVTGGAAGTDRFDSDRHHDRGSDIAGTTPASGRTDDSGTGEHGRENLSRTSGAGGVLGTSDKDFVGRDRKAGTGALGAYADETGPFKGNTSGPGGNTALTGREGTNPSQDNPVARAQSAGQEVGGAPEGTSSHPGVAHGTTNPLSGKEGQEGTSVANEHGEKKGLLQKIKDAI